MERRISELYVTKYATKAPSGSRKLHEGTYNNNQAAAAYGAGQAAAGAAAYPYNPSDLAGMYGAAAAVYSRSAAAVSASALQKAATAAKTKSRSNAGKTKCDPNNLHV